MNTVSDVMDFAAHLDCQDGFGDQLTSSAADNSATQNAVGFGVHQPFGQAIGDTEGLCTAACGPRVDLDINFDPFAFRLFLGDSCPRDFRICEYNSGDRGFVECHIFSSHNFGSNSSFVSCLVGKHGIACDIADSEDIWIRCSLLFIADHESAFVDNYLGIFESDSTCHGTATNADQNPIVLLVAEFVRSFECHFNFVIDLGQGTDFGVQEYTALAEFINLLGEWFDEVAISTRQESIH